MDTLPLSCICELDSGNYSVAIKMNISKEFEHALLKEGFNKHRVTGGVRYIKLVCDDMYLMVVRENGKYRGICNYRIGFNIPSVEKVIADYNVDQALTVGVKLGYEPLLCATFSNHLDEFTSKDSDVVDMKKCFANFTAHVGDNFVLLKKEYLEGLSALRLPDWVGESFPGDTHNCDRFFLCQIQQSNNLSEEFNELCGQDLTIAHWYFEKYLPKRN